MANPAWWLQRALMAHDAMSLAAADAGIPAQDLTTGVTGGTEDAPDYTVSALDTDSGKRATTTGAGVNDAGFSDFGNGALTALQ